MSRNSLGEDTVGKPLLKKRVHAGMETSEKPRSPSGKHKRGGGFQKRSARREGRSTGEHPACLWLRT